MFNLLDEKWLLGIRADGSVEEASIKDCLYQNYKDVRSPDFHGKHFYMYDYLAIRFLSTIVADILICNANEIPMAYDHSIAEIVESEMKEGKISAPFKNAAEKYFQKYHDRFNLFDNMHPFMQFPTVKKSKDDKSFNMNPLAPADSGRIHPESFEFEKRIEATELTKDVCAYLREHFSITPKESAYILLYLASIAPGVGAKNKTVLAGNAFVFETQEGESLYESILLNMPISGYLFDDDDDPVDFGIPTWRWDEIEKRQTEILKTGKIQIMEGMFFPVKRIRLEYDREKISIYEANPKYKDKIGKYVDDLRKLWAKKYEPHALLHQVKSDETQPVNPYRKISPGDNSWLLLAATAQTKSTTVQKKKGNKMVDVIWSAGSSCLMQKASESEKKEPIRIRYYYRIADSKWVYLKTGLASGDLPRRILKESIRQNYLCQMVQYIDHAKDKLAYYSKVYLLNTSGDSLNSVDSEQLKKMNSSKYEKAFMDSLQSVFTGSDSFLFEISETDDLEATYEKWKKLVKKNTLNQFSLLMDQKRMESFWNYYERLSRELN